MGHKKFYAHRETVTDTGAVFFVIPSQLKYELRGIHIKQSVSTENAGGVEIKIKEISNEYDVSPVEIEAVTLSTVVTDSDGTQPAQGTIRGTFIPFRNYCIPGGSGLIIEFAPNPGNGAQTGEYEIVISGYKIGEAL